MTLLQTLMSKRKPRIWSSQNVNYRWRENKMSLVIFLLITREQQQSETGDFCHSRQTVFRRRCE